ncbi:Rieske (2Fe-2S) protein [Rubrobacter indicoceani]|uniref:Rieske (2Fe-2S) protein n=1 Tax=Rubrobacter indicoceani TaxID=2051957 RepID=UPI000E5AAFCD|nr:Rieske 2Fe-2S domain-containing protein [Rubrobacter indicoceani]
MISPYKPDVQVYPDPAPKVKERNRWHFVCRLEEVPEGGMRPFKVGGRRIVVARVGGKLRAVANTCPHEAARMSDGKVERMWHGDRVGEHYQRERCVIVCPWHNFEFDLDTGGSVSEPERMRLKTYPVEVLNGEVLVLV